jgi:1,4-dihydroxy-2-naphthoate octaprenyltransferase
MDGNKALTLIRSMRVPFLLLAPVCVFLGFSTAVSTGARINPLDLILVLFGAVAAHASVNSFNEYFDFRSGLDIHTTKTPFSGGSGALVDHPQSVNAVLYLAIGALCVTVLVGLYFIYRHGVLILPIGLAGILIILAYTQWLTRHPWLCLVAPGTGFGPLMVGGTHFVLTGAYSLYAFYISLVPFFLANNLLLLNQLPDITADRSAGRRHFPIAYGTSNSVVLYGIFAAAASLTIVAGILSGYIPKAGYVCLIPLCAAFAAWAGAMKYATVTERLVPFLGMNVLAALFTPLLLGVVLIIG